MRLIYFFILEETVPQYSDEVFFEHFRVSRATAHYVGELYESSSYYHNQPGQYGNLPAFHQVLIYLWYLGHQYSSFRDVADCFKVTISSINRIITRVTTFLSNLCSEIVKWPNDSEKRLIEEHFRTNGFPNVIGVIDRTHIKIGKPVNDADSYINSKGFYSIQMQAVCDNRSKLLHVFIGYPGSVHHSQVFKNSTLKNTLQEKCGRYFILGDNSYPLTNNLLTPYKDRGNLTRKQQNFNVKLAKNRYATENCFNILRQKFRQLYHLKLRNIRLIVHVIRAACVLHNISLEDNFLINEEHEAQSNQEQHGFQSEDFEEDENEEARTMRDRIASTLPL
ncbi:hypothetical protein O3M35_007419 [Rhynocoris fuscipes]|uniref:Putative nuclease HARBI1 n=1 Tax=Rhynocoris fuscipes TaxID=488301 RepID=A0AAW1DA73_9HEMI